MSLQATSAQLQISRQGQITDRYNAAITNLGSVSVDVRLGGIYALQRIMQDSPRDQPTVVAVLSAFVRDRTKAAAAISARPLASPQTSSGPSHPPTDIQAALTVVRTRDTGNDGFATVVDLSGADLSGADLTGSHFSGAHLSEADLSGADLSGADLSGADLVGANLSYAYLYGANLSGANLAGAHLTAANLTAANLSGANLGGALLTGAFLIRADLAGADLAGAVLAGADQTGAKGGPGPRGSSGGVHAQVDVVRADPSSGSVKCPVTVTFTADISVTKGHGLILYRWVRSNGASAPIQNLKFDQPGTQVVRHTWQLGNPGDTLSQWEAVELLSPADITSDHASFNLTCASPPGLAPTELTAVPGDSQVSLSWRPPAQNGGSPVIGYNIYVGTGPGGESGTPVNGTSPVASTSYTVTGLANGTIYYFTVTAVNAAGRQGPPSSEVFLPVAPLPPPTEPPPPTG